MPLIGRILKWRHARVAMQLPMFLLAALLIVDGLRGPQVAPMNLAGVLPWIHWRGLLILSLLALGNVFCMACPFMLPRTIARRWMSPRLHWPRWLRSKWVAVGLLGLFLWSYEAFSLWDSPWWTAWIAIGYFVAALAIDGLFRGAVFCKYLCPIGQFNFVQSLMSPLEIKVREPARCVSCTTKDCIRGSSDPARASIPGCELNLYQPRKAGNMDCTFCLDCIHACPHDNIGILVAPPGNELWHDPLRSGIGRFGRRPDLAALVLILVFGAFANAAGMVGPVVEWEQQLQMRLRLASPLPIVSGFYLFAIVVLPLLLVAGAAVVSRRVGDPRRYIVANGHALQLRTAAAGIFDVARALFIPPIQQLRHSDSGDAALRRRFGPVDARPAAVELQLLPACCKIGCRGWKFCSWISACCCRSTRHFASRGAIRRGCRRRSRPVCPGRC